MKKKAIFNEPLLISQEEMAMMLGITRSQWSMVVLGERELSAKSKVKFAELLTTANDVAVAKKQKLKQVAQQEVERQQELPLLLTDNLIKQYQIHKKLKQMEEKFQAALNTLYFVKDFKSELFSQSVLEVLGIKANKVLKSNNLKLQERYKIKLEVLKFEEELLRQRE